MQTILGGSEFLNCNTKKKMHFSESESKSYAKCSWRPLWGRRWVRKEMDWRQNHSTCRYACPCDETDEDKTYEPLYVCNSCPKSCKDQYMVHAIFWDVHCLVGGEWRYNMISTTGTKCKHDPSCQLATLFVSAIVCIRLGCTPILWDARTNI